MGFGAALGGLSGFGAAARQELRGWTIERVMDEVSLCEGFWHPTGFAVFHTEQLFEGTPIRVHCWIPGVRPSEPLHPPIHTHVWPLASLVVFGTYREIVYKLEDDRDGPICGYSAAYH